jgi:hypothetical protein
MTVSAQAKIVTRSVEKNVDVDSAGTETLGVTDGAIEVAVVWVAAADVVPGIMAVVVETAAVVEVVTVVEVVEVVGGGGGSGNQTGFQYTFT